MRAKRLLCLVLVLALLVIPAPINAESTTDKNTDDKTDYSLLYKEAIEMIMYYYLDAHKLTEKQLFEAAMRGVFSELDIYSEFMTVEERDEFVDAIEQKYVGIGIKMQQLDGRAMIIDVFDGSPAQKAGLQRGDIIVKVDGKDAPADLNDLVDMVLGEAGTKVSVTVLRNNKTYTYTIERASVNVPSVSIKPIPEVYKGLTKEQEEKIAYIEITTFSSTTGDEFKKCLNTVKEAGAKYLILDLRGNTGGYVMAALEVASKIIPKGDIVHFEDAEGNGVVYDTALEEAPFEIVCLVDEYTASATEFLAGAIQDSGVGVLVGETTYGKGVAQYIIKFTDDYHMKLTFEEFYTRNHNKINGVGIKPDYYVEIPSFMPGTQRYYVNDDLEEVLILEKILTYLGYNVGTVDTKYDSKTFEAVKKFQWDAGLYGYGVCDYNTQKALNIALQKKIWEKDVQVDKAFSIILDKINEK